MSGEHCVSRWGCMETFLQATTAFSYGRSNSLISPPREAHISLLTSSDCYRLQKLLKMMISDLQIICTKVRDGNNRIVRLKEGEPQGRHVVIVDDLVQSGGTLIECQVCHPYSTYLCQGCHGWVTSQTSHLQVKYWHLRALVNVIRHNPSGPVFNYVAIWGITFYYIWRAL